MHYFGYSVSFCLLSLLYHLCFKSIFVIPLVVLHNFVMKLSSLWYYPKVWQYVMHIVLPSCACTHAYAMHKGFTPLREPIEADYFVPEQSACLPDTRVFCDKTICIFLV